MPLYDPNMAKQAQQRGMGTMPTMRGGYNLNAAKAPQQRPMGGPMSRPPAMANLVNKGYGFAEGGSVRGGVGELRPYEMDASTSEARSLTNFEQGKLLTKALKELKKGK